MNEIRRLPLNLKGGLWHHYAWLKSTFQLLCAQYAGKQAAVEVKAGTIGDALSGLVAQHPDLRRHLYTDEGKLRAFVNVYLNDETSATCRKKPPR